MKNKRNYKTVLEEYGFRYVETTDEYVKPLGFGMNIKCAKIFGALFEIKQGNKKLFSNFVGSLIEFEKIISNITSK